MTPKHAVEVDCGSPSSEHRQAAGLPSDGTWCLGKMRFSCLSSSAITGSSPPLHSYPPGPELPGGSRLLVLCLPWALLPARGHGPSGAGSTGSLLCGRLKPGACICLPGAHSVETEHRWLHHVGLQQATFFPLSANPLFPSLSSCHLSPVPPPVDRGTSKTSAHLTLDDDVIPVALSSGSI